ncbi:MAG: hypothetical protein AAF674_19725 [Pseudomonadota bacterium]
MPFVGETFTRIWQLVDQFTAGENVTRSSLDVALDDLAAGINGAAQLPVSVSWDPSTGVFPTVTSAGREFYATAAGTVDGIAFAAGDRIVSITAAPSTTTFAGSWVRTQSAVSLSNSLKYGIFESRAAVAAAQVNSIVDNLLVMGFANATDGQGVDRYVKVATAVTHDLGVSSANGMHFELCPDAEIKATSAGAVNAADNTAAVQSCINAALFAPAATSKVGRRPVQINLHRTTFSDSVHVGWGHENGGFPSVKMRGLGRTEFDADVHPGTIVRSTVLDRPAISIQGSIGGELVGMHITSQAGETALLAGISLTDFTSLCSEAVWDARLAAAGFIVGQNNSAAAVAIDPRSGVKPAGAYPDITYPADYGSQTQYGKNNSAGVKVEDVVTRYWPIGISINGANQDANSDFTNLRGCRAEWCKIGVAMGGTQTRVTSMGEMFLNACYTMIDTVTTGTLAGQTSGDHEHIKGGQSFQVFDLTGQSVNGTSKWFLDIESTFRIGKTPATGAIIPGITFAGRFSTTGTGGDVFAREARCGWLFDCPSNQHIHFNDMFINAHRFAILPTGRVTGKITVSTKDTPVSPYEKMAQNATGGVVTSPILQDYPDIEVQHLRQNIDSSAQGGALTNRSMAETGRSYGIPWWMREGRHSASGHWFDRKIFRGNVGEGQRSSVVRTGRTVTFTHTGINANNYINQGITQGATLVADGGTAMVIRSVDPATGAVAAEMFSNYYDVDGTNWAIAQDVYDPGNSFDPAVGNFLVIPAGVYATERPLTGDFDANSAIIKNVVTDVANAFPVDLGLTVGDYFAVNSYNEALTESTAPQVQIASVRIGLSGVAITGMTNASPGVFTSTGHGLIAGENVRLTNMVGTTGINAVWFTVATVPSVDTFTLQDANGNALDTTSLGTYSGSGGLLQTNGGYIQLGGNVRVTRKGVKVPFWQRVLPNHGTR